MPASMPPSTPPSSRSGTQRPSEQVSPAPHITPTHEPVSATSIRRCRPGVKPAFTRRSTTRVPAFSAVTVIVTASDVESLGKTVRLWGHAPWIEKVWSSIDPDSPAT